MWMLMRGEELVALRVFAVVTAVILFVALGKLSTGEGIFEGKVCH
jgi:hypothetical protein